MLEDKQDIEVRKTEEKPAEWGTRDEKLHSNVYCCQKSWFVILMIIIMFVILIIIIAITIYLFF